MTTKVEQLDRHVSDSFFMKESVSTSFISRIKKDLTSLPKTLIVGAVATAADMATLAIMVQVFDFSPQSANVPSLIIGSLIQFVGNRYISFHGAREGKVHRQMLGFFIAEVVALAVNALLFHALITWTPISYPVARPLGTALVFFGLSYPAWRYIFRGRREK